MNWACVIPEYPKQNEAVVAVLDGETITATEIAAGHDMCWQLNDERPPLTPEQRKLSMQLADLGLSDSLLWSVIAADAYGMITLLPPLPHSKRAALQTAQGGRYLTRFPALCHIHVDPLDSDSAPLTGIAIRRRGDDRLIDAITLSGDEDTPVFTRLRVEEILLNYQT